MKKKVFIGITVSALILSFFFFDLGRFIHLDFLQVERSKFLDFYHAKPFLTLLSFFFLYIFIAALSLPGAAVLTLLAGALFGFFPALFLVSFASTIGASLSFLCSRFLFREWLEKKFSNQFDKINQGIKREGKFYLFTLRLIPVFPFFVINLVMGLSSMKLRDFFWVSQLGMLPGTIVFVNAGKELGKIQSLSGLLSVRLIFAFALLGILPLFFKRCLKK